MLKTVRPVGLHLKPTDIAIPSLESIKSAIRQKLYYNTSEGKLSQSQLNLLNELTNAVHDMCMELKNNPAERIITSHKMDFMVHRAPNERVMYYSMGYPSNYIIRPVDVPSLPRGMCCKAMLIPVANRLVLYYVDKNTSEHRNIPLEW